jgi:hypothetical protein
MEEMTEQVLERVLDKIGAMKETMISNHEEIMTEMRAW